MSEIETLVGTVVQSIEALRRTGLRVVERIRMTNPEPAVAVFAGKSPNFRKLTTIERRT